MKKGSALIITIVIAVAFVGLALIFSGNIESPTGNAVGSGSSIPLVLSGQILNCGRSEGKLLFVREDGTSSEGKAKKFRGKADNSYYAAKVRAFRNQPTTLFEVSWKDGRYKTPIQTLVIDISTISASIGAGSSIPFNIDLSCATPVPTETPVPSETPAPSETPTDVPTEEPTEVPTDVPTEEPTVEPTITSVPTVEPSVSPTAPPTTPSQTSTSCVPFGRDCTPGVSTCCDAGVPCREVGVGIFVCAT